MYPKKLSMKPAPKKVPITTALKKEIIQKYKEGKWIIDTAHEYSKASSTIAMIIKKKKDIKGFAEAKGVTLIASKKQLPEILNEAENLLVEWINEKQLGGDSITSL